MVPVREEYEQTIKDGAVKYIFIRQPERQEEPETGHHDLKFKLLRSGNKFILEIYFSYFKAHNKRRL